MYVLSWNPNYPCFDWKRPSFGGKTEVIWVPGFTLIDIKPIGGFIIIDLTLSENLHSFSWKYPITEMYLRIQPPIHQVFGGFQIFGLQK